MNNIFLKISILFFLVPAFVNGQVGSTSLTSDTIPTPGSLTGESLKSNSFHGFVRGGFYGSIDDADNKPYVSSSFADFGLKVESEDGHRFKALTDLRFRYGTEFLEPVSRFEIVEAYVTANGKKWDLSMGQKIIKWGRADFTNPTSKLNPQNLVSRSPDHSDMDLGNLLMSARWYPSPVISFEAVTIPFYRSSKLLIGPIPLPEYVSINKIESLITEKQMFSYGLKTDLYIKNVDLSLSWFDGYDPMPGTALTNFILNLDALPPEISIDLSLEPYKIRNLGFDYETAIGAIGLRGEAAWSFPYKSYETYEYVPMQEIKWVAGIDWSPGNWRFTGEYSGKAIPNFKPSPVDPFIGTEFDMTGLAAMLAADPGFDIQEYVRQQVGAFNRLYNYQLEKSYHSAGLRVETDLFYGKLTPSVFTLYNFTSRDFVLMPELTYKPADRLSINIGGEYYSGRKGSVYDIVDEFMNCIRVSMRVDF
jgi:hypothetical protein